MSKNTKYKNKIQSGCMVYHKFYVTATRHVVCHTSEFLELYFYYCMLFVCLIIKIKLNEQKERGNSFQHFFFIFICLSVKIFLLIFDITALMDPCHFVEHDEDVTARLYI